MKKISVKKISIDISDFDTLDTIKKKFIANIVDGPIKLVPRFIEDFEIKPNKKSYNPSIILDDISKEKSINSLFSNKHEYFKKYKYIDNAELAFLWIILNGYADTGVEDLYSLVKDVWEVDLLQNLKEYKNARLFISELKRYQSSILKEHENALKSIKKIDEMYDALHQYKNIPASEFSIEKIRLRFKFLVKQNKSLYEIFDLFTVSLEIPFIVLVDDSNIYYKVHRTTDIRLLREWATKDYNADGIHMYVSREGEDGSYDRGMWYPDNSFLISSEIQKGYDSFDEKRILKHIKLEIDVAYVTEEMIKGAFEMNFKLNKAVLADMVSTNDIFKYFLFINEPEIPILSKSKFQFYFSPDQTGEIETALTITLSAKNVESDTVSVRVGRATSISHINSFSRILRGLISLYNNDINKIKAKYKKLYKEIDIEVHVPKESVVENGKTGKRIVALKKRRPDIFGAGYTNVVNGRNPQPYPVTDYDKTYDIMETAQKTIGLKLATLDSYSGNPYGMMRFPLGSDEWYACYPREPDDTSDEYIWPGLKKANKKYKNIDKFPYLPVCYKTNQYTRKGSVLYKQLRAEQGVPEFTAVKKGRPLGPTKLAPPGRFAELPYYLQRLAISSGVEYNMQKNKVYLAVLRYGVTLSPSSFLYCLERATNREFVSLLENEQVERISEIRKELASMDFSVGKQELFEFTDTEIRDILLDENAYIDPKLFTRIASVYFKCNIVLFEVNKQFPHGEICTPKNDIAYLAVPSSEIPSIFIVIQHPTETTPQCELIVLQGKKAIETQFTTSDFAKTILSVSDRFYQVYSINCNSGFFKYTL